MGTPDPATGLRDATVPGAESKPLDVQGFGPEERSLRRRPSLIWTVFLFSVS